MKMEKLPYQHLSEGFRGTVKNALNAILNPLGVELSSTLEQRIEDERIRKLRKQGHWAEPKYMQGLELEDERWLKFLRDTCLPFRADYEKFAINPNGDATQYFLDNGWFGSVDAEMLYSIVRSLEPANIIEVGSGFSTRVMRRAIKEGELRSKVTSIDPHPNTTVEPYSDEYIKSAVEDVALQRIVDALDANDILFIDSSHCVTTGGDIPYLFLEILPRLKRGVLIHIHDIFLPMDYPVQWVVDNWGWTEQYLVHAFLCFNNAFEILWPAHYMWEFHRREITEVIPVRVANAVPSSLWLRKIE